MRSRHSITRLLAVCQGVANRDIKLENTLLSSTVRPVIKICDFGYSKVRSLFQPLVHLVRHAAACPLLCLPTD